MRNMRVEDGRIVSLGFEPISKTKPPTQRTATMLHASAVVVWEWLNEHGRWRPYSPTVSHHIEAVIRSDPRGGSVVLGQVDNRLSPYILDLQSMHQFRQDTGKKTRAERWEWLLLLWGCQCGVFTRLVLFV
uniref:E3 ubiquitin-protein ligase DTX4-like n=1 Tax=Oncorhynchus gorbuscha TaxID=8017 RepID=UPI001EAF0ED4|nr:E3 ubiquitin-protein ligase DTX4-like [Oncorhynchus gorbuscha]